MIQQLAFIGFDEVLVVGTNQVDASLAKLLAIAAISQNDKTNNIFHGYVHEEDAFIELLKQYRMVKIVN